MALIRAAEDGRATEYRRSTLDKDHTTHDMAMRVIYDGM